jgi:hypothetical protein
VDDDVLAAPVEDPHDHDCRNQEYVHDHRSREAVENVHDHRTG